MDKKYTSVEEQVEFGLDAVDGERLVEVPLRDLLYVYETLGEFVRYFHQPAHYPSLEAVQKFIGNKNEGAAHLLWECYYRKLYDVWPEDIRQQIQDGDFEHPQPPYYFNPEEIE